MTHWKICPECKGEGKIPWNNFHIITEDDLKAKAVIEIAGKKFPSYSIFGGLRSFDVGKMLKVVNGIIYIENNEQYEERIDEEMKNDTNL